MSAPPLVLLHGWGLDRTVWSPCLSALAARTPVQLADLPGYGHTPACTDFDAAARALAAALPIGATLCGWSLGALLAMRAALLVPAAVRRLILVGATPRFVQSQDWRPAQPDALLDSFAAAVRTDPQATRSRFTALFNQGDRQARSILRTLARDVLTTPLPTADVLTCGLDWLRQTDLSADVARIACPTLLVHGEQDSLMPPTAAQWLATRLPHARLTLFPGAAHAPFLHDADGFASCVGDFLDATAST